MEAVSLAVDLHVVHILYVFFSQFFSELPSITLSLRPLQLILHLFYLLTIQSLP